MIGQEKVGGFRSLLWLFRNAFGHRFKSGSAKTLDSL